MDETTIPTSSSTRDLTVATATTTVAASGTRRRERGVSMIEVMVASFVVLVVGTAVTATLLGSLRTQVTSSDSERRLAAAEGLFERMKADSAWAGPGGADCASMHHNATEVQCDEAKLIALLGDAGLLDQSTAERALRFEAMFDVRGIDDDYDGAGKDDEDGMRPDYYEATVGVRLEASDDEWTTLSGTVNPPGRLSTGSIRIDVCRVQRQWDERSPIAACPSKSEVLLGYPAGSAVAALAGSSSDPHASADWSAALNRAAPASGATGWDMVTYDVEPAPGVTVELRRNDGGEVRTDGFISPAGCSSPSTDFVRCTTGGDGTRTVAGLIPGHYDVTISGTPPGYEPWPLHSIPSGDTAIVESGRRSRVLQVIKPVVRDSYTVNLHSCDHSEVPGWGAGPCVDNIQPYGLSGWLAPAASARAHWSFDSASGIFGSGIESVGAGATEITFDQLPPGLFSPRIVTARQKSIKLTEGVGGAPLEFMWIDPVKHGLGGDRPASGVPTYTRHWCDYDRRVAYLASVGLPSTGGRKGPYYWYEYDIDGNVTATHEYYIYYYSAEGTCPNGGGSGGGPPGPGSGGA